MNLLLIKALYHRHVVQSTNSIFLQALTPKKKKGHFVHPINCVIHDISNFQFSNSHSATKSINYKVAPFLIYNVCIFSNEDYIILTQPFLLFFSLLHDLTLQGPLPKLPFWDPTKWNTLFQSYPFMQSWISIFHIYI